MFGTLKGGLELKQEESRSQHSFYHLYIGQHQQVLLFNSRLSIRPSCGWMELAEDNEGSICDKVWSTTGSVVPLVLSIG